VKRVRHAHRYALRRHLGHRRAQQGLFSQLEAAATKRPGCVVLGGIEWDPSGRVVSASDAVLGVSGYTQQVVAARDLSMHQLFSQSTLQSLTTLPPGQVLDCELLARSRAPVPVLLCVALASAPTGNSQALLLSSASLNLQLQLDALILGVVSHELRTPLGVISMAANLLLSDDISSAQRRTLQRITTASRHCDRLVSDLLDFTAVRGSGITLLRGQRDLHAITAQALDDVRVTWPGRTVEHERLGVAESYLDEDRVAQVITNLVNNALQHSPPGTKVLVETRGDSECAVLTVTNFGSAIPTELIPQLFSPLRRGDSAGHRRGSLGLGLFIVRHLVVAHDGTIDVRSNSSEGTRFTIRFPKQP
jgi:signal transduction histidine kinase